MNLAITYEGKLLPPVQDVLVEVLKGYPQITDVEEFNEFTTDRTTPTLVLGVLPPVLPTTFVKTLSQKQILSNPAAITELRAALDALLSPVEWPDVEIVPVTILSASQEANLGGVVVLDIETGGDINTMLPEEMWLLSVALYDGKNCYVYREEALELPQVRAQLMRIIKTRKLIAHNMKFDFRTLSAHFGQNIYGHLDTMLLHHAINPGAKEHGLKPLCRKYLGAPDWDGDAKSYVKGHGVGFEAIPRDILYTYNGWDVIWTWRLYEYLAKAAADERTAKLARMEFEYGNFYQDVESNGFAVDIPYLRDLSVSYGERKLESLEKLQDMGGNIGPKGAAFNPGSPQQVKRWFLERGIKLASTDEKHLEELAQKEDLSPKVQEFIDELLEYRGIAKTIGTNIEGILKRVHYDNLVFPDFLVHGTNTGRTSSRDPNIQNIPRDKTLRKIFVSRDPENNVILNVDYSQAELRVMACMSEDPYLISLFQPEAGDFFDALMPSAFPRENIEEWTKQEAKDNRAKLKAVIYGMSYGRKANAIAKSLEMPVQEAQAIITNYFRAAPALYDWRAWVEEIAIDPERTLVSPFGRYYQAEIVTGRNQQNVKNAGLAFLPQSTASDLCVNAAMKTHLWCGEYGAKIVATVHDAIMLDCPKIHVEEVARRVQWEMEESGRRVFGDVVPFATDAQWGANWGEAG